ncbi:Linoleate 10R-lipoxygenase [Escovopsis weberi]|uniref:Linoleate 10R-lipoxygenase n=1 Tax=Escovopsis weberi TaxID=150374 RepID=A0A0M9VS77_ESCWE|nr:Linoleate 10R-lipoxygenase [Escovopsis weberi]
MSSNRTGTGSTKASNHGGGAREYPHGPVAPAVKKRVVKQGGLRDMYKASRRPLPTELGDGTYRTVPVRPTLMQEIASIKLSGLKTLKEIIKAKLSGEVYQDDKTMIMERTIQLVAGMPNNSKRQEALTNDFIDKLWYSLDHPPLLYMGDEFRFRQADGSNNNPLMPRLGAAGTPYSRSCQPRVVPLGALPDPEAVFEAVMARRTFTRNANNVSSILWYWATIIIHDLFSTNAADANINDASSYLDLAPLYGHSQAAQDSVRTFKDGMLKPDAFADKRLLGMPPGVCVLLVMLNRVHNHVAGRLAAINEDNRFARPAAEAEAEAWRRYDEELFQTARLVTSGLYINITLIDYVRNIINLNRVDTEWTLDPRQASGVDVGTAQGSERGVGNAVSAEFNLCYRWHSCLSEWDEEWLRTFFDELLGEDEARGEVGMRELALAMRRFAAGIPADPGACTFGGYQRGADGRFDDDDLVACIATAVEQPAGSFGARNVPRIMKPVEMMGILRGRKWHLAGLNEFRRHFGMKAYETFEDINSDPEVADALRNLYQHPDYVELYPGIVAEEAKSPMVPGVGITPTYTISRVVLSDAVALVRGDRHYTTDYTPQYLTRWGFREVDYDLKVNHGCVFHKLFLRAFPDHFRHDSVYAHYPMVIPEENRKILAALGRVDRFTFDRPRFHGRRLEMTTYGGARQVLGDEARFRVPWREVMGHLSGAGGSSSSSSKGGGPRFMEAEDRKTFERLLFRDGWRAVVRDFYARTAERLLERKAFRLNGHACVDAVRDVGNAAQTRFAAEVFNLPLKTADHPRGVLTEHELYAALAAVHMCVFRDGGGGGGGGDPVQAFALLQKTREAAGLLAARVATGLRFPGGPGRLGLFTGRGRGNVLAAWGAEALRALAAEGLGGADAAWGLVVPAAAAMVPTQGRLFAQALDWYLSPSGREHVPALSRLAGHDGSEEGVDQAETDALLLGYALEGVRMAGAFGLETVAAGTDTVAEDDGRRVNVNAGDRVYVSFAAAGMDPARFPSPERVDPRRPVDAYVQVCAGTHSVLGREACLIGLVELFRAVFRRKNLRRVPGAQGELKTVARAEGGDGVMYLTEDGGTLSPFPQSMKVMWDA